MAWTKWTKPPISLEILGKTASGPDMDKTRPTWTKPPPRQGCGVSPSGVRVRQRLRPLHARQHEPKSLSTRCHPSPKRHGQIVPPSAWRGQQPPSDSDRLPPLRSPTPDASQRSSLTGMIGQAHILGIRHVRPRYRPRPCRMARLSTTPIRPILMVDFSPLSRRLADPEDASPRASGKTDLNERNFFR